LGQLRQYQPKVTKTGCTMRVLLCIGIAFVVLGVVAFVLPLSDEPQHGTVPLLDLPTTTVSDTDTASIVVGTLLVSAGLIVIIIGVGSRRD
jgi:hypothetical protein